MPDVNDIEYAYSRVYRYIKPNSTDPGTWRVSSPETGSSVPGSGGAVQFRGSVDLNISAAAQTPPVSLPATNGDLYIVEVDADPINADWVINGNITVAIEGDYIVWDTDNNYWVLVSGASPGGAVTKVSTTDANSNGSLTVSPTSGDVVIEIKTSDTSNYGVVQVADTDDISNGTPGASAIVDASHLKTVSDSVDTLTTEVGALTTEVGALTIEVDGLITGVSSVATTDVNGNAALTINPNAGDVIAEIATSSDTQYGVVQIADAQDITDGTAGASAVVDASQLKTVTDSIPVVGDLVITAVLNDYKPYIEDRIYAIPTVTGGAEPVLITYQWRQEYGVIVSDTEINGATDNNLYLPDTKIGYSFKCYVTAVDNNGNEVLADTGWTSPVYEEPAPVDPGVTKLVAGTQIEITPADGTGEVTINSTAETLVYRGTVDVTIEKPLAFDTLSLLKQDLYLNTGEGTFHPSWADITDNATTATEANPGDFMVYNQTTYDHIPAGAPPSTTGLWVENSSKLYPVTLANNVGIGTDNPQTKLDVLGDIAATNFRIDLLTELP